MPAAQTRFFLAKALAQQGEIERSRDMLTELSSNFQGWSIPVWQQKCEQKLEAISSLEHK